MIINHEKLPEGKYWALYSFLFHESIRERLEFTRLSFTSGNLRSDRVEQLFKSQVCEDEDFNSFVNSDELSDISSSL
jgi:hypothetical protein